MIYCNGLIMATSCSEGNVIHVDRVMFGDFYYLSYMPTCSSLLSDYSGEYGRYHCEVDVLAHNISYYNEVMAACAGKTRCDSRLQARSGPALGWCKHGSGLNETELNHNTPTDYMVLEYYCYPGLLPGTCGMLFGDWSDLLFPVILY